MIAKKKSSLRLMDPTETRPTHSNKQKGKSTTHKKHPTYKKVFTLRRTGHPHLVAKRLDKSIHP